MAIGYHGDDVTALGYFKFHQVSSTHIEWVTVAWARFIVLRGARCLQRSTTAGKEELLECEEKRRGRCYRAGKKMQSIGLLFFWGCPSWLIKWLLIILGWSIWRCLCAARREQLKSSTRDTGMFSKKNHTASPPRQATVMSAKWAHFSCQWRKYQS